MIISTPTMAALRTQLELRFGAVYQETPVWWPQLATEIPSSTASNTYAWIAAAIRLREWVGPRQAQAMGEHDYVLANLPYEATFQIRRQHILDDNLGLYTSVIVPQFAEATSKHPDNEIIAKVFAANPVAFDGRPFFDTLHPTYNGAGTYSNDFDYALDDADLIASAVAIQTVRTAMRTILGENGQILSTDPRLLVVPSELEYVAHKLTRSETFPVKGVSTDTAATTIDNWLRGVVDYLVIPELSAISPTDWYLFDTSKSIKPIIWQTRSRPVLRSFDAPTDWDVFLNDQFTYGIDGDDGGPYRAAAGVTLPFLAARSGPT